MLSEMEKRIRECYDAFLEAVTEDRDLWEIALLEYYRWPLEDWREEPEDQMTLALRLKELCERPCWHAQLEEYLDEEERDWLLDLMEDLLEDAFRRGCGAAGWPVSFWMARGSRQTKNGQSVPSPPQWEASMKRTGRLLSGVHASGCWQSAMRRAGA